MTVFTMKDVEEELKEDIMIARANIRAHINEEIKFENEGDLARAYNSFRKIAGAAIDAASAVEALIWLGKAKKSD